MHLLVRSAALLALAAALAAPRAPAQEGRPDGAPPSPPVEPQVGASPSASGPDQPVQAELEALRREVEALRSEQRRMRVLLERLAREGRQPEAPTFVDLEGAPRKGNEQARLVLVEVADYQCPFCARHALRTAPQIEERYVESGNLQLAFLDLPLPMHPHAPAAAAAARCAGEQGRFWEMHDLLFRRSARIAPGLLADWAAELDLDADRVRECLADGRQAAEVERSGRAARAAGVQSTPTFLLGYAEEGTSRLEVVERIEGAHSLQRFVQVIDRLLATREAPVER